MKMTTEKRLCNNCNEVKSIELFERDKRAKGGYTSRCKQCKFDSNSKPRRAFRRLYERQKDYPIPVETSAKEFEQLYEVYNDRCVYCYQSYDSTPTFDHITPLSLGGRHRASNLTVCCKSCNSRKGDKPLLVFYDDFEQIHPVNLATVIKIMARLSRRTVAEVEQELNEQRDEYYKKAGGAAVGKQKRNYSYTG